MTRYNVPTYQLEVVTGCNVRRLMYELNATEIQSRLRQLRLDVDPLWIPLQFVAIYAGDTRMICYTWQDNDENLTCPALWNQTTRSLRMEWDRLIRAVRIEMGRRRAAEWLHRARLDADHGGQLLEEDLEAEGLHPGSTATRQGYCSRSISLVDSLDVYTGAYGAGLTQRMPRFDTNNYMYVRYWLYDLEEVTPYGT